MNTQSEPKNMLFYGHRTKGEVGSPAIVGFDFASHHNSVTTLYIGSYKGYTKAHMAYLEVA